MDKSNSIDDLSMLNASSTNKDQTVGKLIARVAKSISQQERNRIASHVKVDDDASDYWTNFSARRRNGIFP